MDKSRPGAGEVPRNWRCGAALTVFSCLAVLALGGVCVAQRVEMKKDAWRFLDEDIFQWLQKGEAAYKEGNYREAGACFLSYLQRNMRDVRVMYNLACCYARLGQADAAAELIRRAVAAGLNDPELLRRDPDIDKARSSPLFQRALEEAVVAAKEQGTIMYIEAPRVMHGYYRLPEGYSAEKAYPLVVALHGNGSNAEEFMRGLAAKHFPDVICAAPEGAYTRWDLGFYPGHRSSWFLEGLSKTLWAQVDPPTETYILRVIEAISRKFKISEVYLLGFSQGVSAAYLTGLHNPDKIAGVLAYAGVLPQESITDAQFAAAVKMPICIIHGKNDPSVRVDASRKARDFFKTKGFVVEYREFEGGHEMPADMIDFGVAWVRKNTAPVQP